MNRYFAIQQAEREAHIYIFGDIVPFELFDSDVSAYGIVSQIESMDVDVIHVHIDSYGGAVSEGWAIYNALKNHPARVVTYADGFVASAALYPFMAGEERNASNLSAFYFHEVIVSASGYADDLRAAANEAEMMTEIGISAFTESTGMSAEEVKRLMQSETWMTPAEALEHGIATAITSDPAPRHMQSVKRNVMRQILSDREPKEPLQNPEVKQEQDHTNRPGNSIIQMLAGIFNA